MRVAIPGFPGYSVTESGGVFRDAGDRPQTRAGWKPTRFWPESELKPRLSNCGYQRVLLASHKRVSVHRLVALAFLGLPPEGRPYVNHKDGDKGNNNVANLEWCSAKENAEHAVRIGLRDGVRERISVANSKPIRTVLPSGQEELFKSGSEAAKHGFDPKSISLACRGLWKKSGHKYRGRCWYFLNLQQPGETA